MHVCALYQLSLTLASCLIDVLELFLTALAFEGTFAHPLQTIRHQQLQVKAQIITASSGWDFYRIGRSHLHSYYFMTCKRELGKRLVIIAVFVALSVCQSCGCRSSAKAKEIGKSAICILHPQGGSGVKGIVTMHQQSPFHPLYYEFGVTGLESLKHHGVHIHEFGDLTQGCKSAGAHYNPYQKTHGGPKDANRHAGDLGNLIANERGVVESCMVDRVTTLFGDRSIIGRSVVVHRNKDDLGRGGDEQSTKTGNAGPRIACGVIGLASKFKNFSLNPSSHQMQLQQ